MKKSFPAYIQNGRLKVFDRAALSAYVQNAENAGATLAVEIHTNEKPISRMRRYYYGVIARHIQAALSGIMGHEVSLEDTHALLKSKFFFREIIDPESGEIIKTPKSLSDTGAEHAEVLRFIEDCIFWASDFLGVDIPPAVGSDF